MQPVIMHLVTSGVTLCGYTPPNGWAFDSGNRWADVSQPEQCSCAACAKVLRARQDAVKKTT